MNAPFFHTCWVILTAWLAYKAGVNAHSAAEYHELTNTLWETDSDALSDKDSGIDDITVEALDEEGGQ
jgi:hypothetical protein